MLYMMRKKTNYEYLKRRRQLIIYFSLDVLSYSIGTYIGWVERKQNLIMKQVDAFQLIMSALFLLNAHEIFLGFAIIYMKASQDVIQEISRLDRDYEISQFQKYTLKYKDGLDESFNL